MTSPDSERVGGAHVDVSPRADNFAAELRAQVLPGAEAAGRDIAEAIARPIVAKIREAVEDGIKQSAVAAKAAAKVAGRKIGETLGGEIRTAIEKKLAGGFTVKVDADVSAAEAAVVALRAKLEAIDDIEVKVDADTSAAEAAVTALRAKLSGIDDVEVKIQATVTGESDVDAMVTALVGLASVGDVDVAVRVAITGASVAEIRRLAKAVTDLRAAAGRIDLDIRANVAAPTAAINQLTRDARRLQGIGTITINMRTTGFTQAMVDLHTVAAFARTLGAMRPEITVTANVTLAVARLAAVLGLAASIGAMHPTVTVNINITGLIPAGAGLAAIQAQAAGASASILALGGAFAILALLAIPVLAGIVAALAAVATAAVVAIGVFAAVGLALFGVIAAVQAVTAAEKAQGQAAAQAASQQMAVKAAADQVRNAERGLANAQREAQAAQEGLTRARKEAREANEDLAISVAENGLAQRQAQLDAKEAKEELDKVLKDPNATKEQREQAKINYERATLQIKDLSLQGKRLSEQQQDANKKGIEGSDQVRAAQERVRAANEGVIAAQQQLAAAHRQAGQAATQAATSSNAAMDKMRETMAALTPEGRSFVKFIIGLKDEFLALRQAAERSFLPGLQRGITAFLPVLPVIITLIEKFGAAMGTLAEEALTALASPFWRSFFEWLGTTGVPIFMDFARAIGYLAKGFVALLMGFGPLSKDFSEGLLNMAKAFADWAQEVVKSEGFQRFLNYVRETGPRVVGLLGDFAVVAIKLAIALAPLATLTLTGLTILFDWLAKQSPGVLIAIAAGIAAIGLALAIAFGGAAAVAAGVVAAVTLIVGGLVYAYQKVDWFRKAVDATWKAITTALSWYWENVMKPVFMAIWWLLKDVLAPVFVWLWKNVVGPALSGIATAATWLWVNVLQPTFTAIWKFIREVLGPIFVWLYENVVKPVWTSIKFAIDVAWAIIQVIFGLLVGLVKVVGAIFMWLWREAVKPTLDFLVGGIKTTWATVKPVFDLLANYIDTNVAPKFKSAVDNIGKIWDKLKELTKIPIRFFVDTVLNNGLLGAYRWLANKFDLPNKDVRVDLPPGFATGGHVRGRGNGTSDDILARLSNGEYVIPTKIVRELGVDFFDQLIGKKRTAKSASPIGSFPYAAGGHVPAFRDGGLVGWLSDTWSTLTDPVGKIKEEVAKLLAKIPGGPMMKDVVVGTGRKLVNDAIGWIQDKVGGWLNVGYGGPEGGPGPGFLPWPGSPGAQRGDTGVWKSILALVRGSGIPYSFGNAYRHGDPLWHGSGRAIDFMGYNQDALARFFMQRQANVLELIHTTPLGGYYISRGRRRASMGEQDALHRNHLHIAMSTGGLVGADLGVDVGGATPPGVSVGTFDSGGWLLPGLTYAMNNTGRPERILTGDQWDEINNKGSRYVTNIYPQRAEFRMSDLEAAQRRQEALARIRRPG